MSLLHDFFSIPFRVGSDSDALLPALLTHSSTFSYPTLLSYSSGKSYIARKEADKDNFISLAGLRSHVCEAETVISLATITGASGKL